MIIANRKGFTLLELVIWIVVISLGLIWIIVMMQWWLKFVDRTRQDVVAINLAREWVEAVYNVRNTNWLQRSWKRSQCWLIHDSFENLPSTECESITWLWSWYYILEKAEIENQWYFRFNEVVWAELNLSDGLSSVEEQFALCDTWTWWLACPWSGSITSEGRYYRQIIGKWLYRKDAAIDWWKKVLCDNWQDIDDGWDDCDTWPLEYRFCVRVAVIKQNTSQVELCSVLTNFE